MESKLAYNLYNRKPEFVRELRRSGYYLSSDTQNVCERGIRGIPIGRILTSNPPYFVLYNPTRSNLPSRSQVSRLKKIAESFR